MIEIIQIEIFGFQIEVKQLLQLMIYLLYFNKEIFLCELVFNVVDVVDKLCFEVLIQLVLLEGDSELCVCVSFDVVVYIIIIEDNGIGMSCVEVIVYFGIIVKFGIGDFLWQLFGDQKKDLQLIGQFGVGFYSVFIVVDEVEVILCCVGLVVVEGVCWILCGEGDFEVVIVDKVECGICIVLYLKDGEYDFVDGWCLCSIFKKYFDYIGLLIQMLKEGEEGVVVEWEIVNCVSVLWICLCIEISDVEYIEFYKYVVYDYSDLLVWSYNKVEGKLEYILLLYVFGCVLFDLYYCDVFKGLKLYVQCVFVMDQVEQFLLLYLCFIKGVVDFNDLLLNVLCEILQFGLVIDLMKLVLIKCLLDMLEKLVIDKFEQYVIFWKEFGQVLKEGLVEDYNNCEKVVGLLCFVFICGDGDVQIVLLVDYIGCMIEGQDKIYYLIGESYSQVCNSLYLEVFCKKGVEVLLLIDCIDEWLMGYLIDFDGKGFVDIVCGDFDLGVLEIDVDKQVQEVVVKDKQGLVEWFKMVLGDEVVEVCVLYCLIDLLVVLVIGEQDLGLQMCQILEVSGQKVLDSKLVLEINLGYLLIVKFDVEVDGVCFDDFGWVLFDQVVLVVGDSLKDLGVYVVCLNKLLLELLV